MVRFAIVGYGNLGKGVEDALLKRNDAKIVGIFSRRDPQTVLSMGTPVYSYDTLFEMKDQIDVCILCGGSAKDLPIQTPEISQYFNTVDSFDNHGEIENHLKNVNDKITDTVSIISVGWDPGLFSMMRLLSQSVLGSFETFWGPGVSQGHSDALRRVEGVLDAIQITVPSEDAMTRARDGETNLNDKHTRVCYVVKGDRDASEIEAEIKNTPGYFLGYETTVHFVDAAYLRETFPTMPHGGFVIGSDGDSIMEFKLQLKSNPKFTSQVLVAYGFAAFEMKEKGLYGAHTVYDVAPKYLLKNNQSLL